MGHTVDIIDARSLKGYHLTSTGSAEGYRIGRLGELTTKAIRYLMHSLMLLSAHVYEGKTGPSTVASLMYPNSVTLPSRERVIGELQLRVAMDFEAMKSQLELEDQDLAMGLHMLLFRLSDTNIPLAIATSTDR
jgi:hypothetical protein